LSLGYANGMTTLQNLAIPLMSFTVTQSSRSDHVKMHAAKTLAEQMLDRVFLSYFLENAIQLNLQSTLYALGIAVKRRSDAENQLHVLGLSSLVVTLLMTSLKLVEVAEFFKVARVSKNLASQSTCPHISLLCNVILRSALSIMLICALLVLSLLYAVAKLRMAHICEDAVWNITGCVSLHKVT